MKIVLVEDNEVLAKSIVKVLTKEGYSVRHFVDGLEAQSFLFVEKNAIDLLIVDYMLPGLDGVALIKSLREEHMYLPILMLTARDQVQDKVSGLKNGADYYLTKPFEFEELLACIEALRRRPNQYAEEIVQMSDTIRFNKETRTLSIDDDQIQLTPTESSILEYLVRNKGKTISQFELGEHVFDFAKENWSNTIEVHIKNLRKKFIHTHHENPIKTIRGLGYRLEI